MIIHPYIAPAIAKQHQRDLIAAAEVSRRARAARNGRPARDNRLPRLARIFLRQLTLTAEPPA